MKGNVRKVIAMVLTLSLLVGTTVCAQDNQATDMKNNPFVEGVSEEVVVDGTDYSYEYDMQNGNRVTHITNEETSETDTLVYDTESGIFYLNGEKIGAVEECLEETPSATETEGTIKSSNNARAKASTYKYIGTKNKKITWKEGVAAAVVAAIIASALVYVTGKMVIATMGLKAVSWIAKNCVGGNLTQKIYQMKAGKLTNIKLNWSLTTNKGKKYGPYTSYAEA